MTISHNLLMNVSAWVFLEHGEFH